VQLLQLVGLIAAEPGDAAGQQLGRHLHAIVGRQAQAAHHDRRGCADKSVRPQPENQPQPPSATCISASRSTPAVAMRGNLGSVEHWIGNVPGVLARQARRGRGFSQFLGVQISLFFAAVLPDRAPSRRITCWATTVGRNRFSVCSVQP